MILTFNSVTFYPVIISHSPIPLLHNFTSREKKKIELVTNQLINNLLINKEINMSI